jgi:hypothetical protein
MVEIKREFCPGKSYIVRKTNPIRKPIKLFLKVILGLF